MATTSRSSLQGFRELDRVLKAMPSRLAERELTSAVRAGPPGSASSGAWSPKPAARQSMFTSWGVPDRWSLKPPRRPTPAPW